MARRIRKTPWSRTGCSTCKRRRKKCELPLPLPFAVRFAVLVPGRWFWGRLSLLTNGLVSPCLLRDEMNTRLTDAEYYR
ncbi:hypothetical protein V8C44DRAFT_306389 [Trichoderma aethiopicum]